LDDLYGEHLTPYPSTVKRIIDTQRNIAAAVEDSRFLRDFLKRMLYKTAEHIQAIEDQFDSMELRVYQMGQSISLLGEKITEMGQFNIQELLDQARIEDSQELEVAANEEVVEENQ
jgi:Mg2+ and Co2+ transporter CorA